MPDPAGPVSLHGAPPGRHPRHRPGSDHPLWDAGYDLEHSGPDDERRAAMSKRGRKRRSRKGSKANHGKRPNA
ncbi:hypothetical protein SAMN05660657_00582 [Geodermatophilus amargosae]|uniref:Uncharacterized protein n=1 Tax=Geodermatophilus amargosae TaxID=1296565 RepID=A0A1I6XRL9_9ACTN|nr:hypothetical protein SAMN05660657_00582 [Geodermatophilus amargosae]